MKLLFALPIVALGCAGTPHTPAQEPPSGEVTVIDLNATPPPAPPPKEESSALPVAPEDLKQAAEQAGIIGVLKGNEDQGAVMSGLLGDDEEGGVVGGVAGGSLGTLGLNGPGGGIVGLLGGGSGQGMTGLGTFGSGAGAGPGQGYGVGAGALGGLTPMPSKITLASTSVSGRLPAEVIQRIVRMSFGRFRRCHESGLRQNPSLQGTIAVRFVISTDGSVKSAAIASMNFADNAVASCISQAFLGLSFPQPESGIVTVTSQLVLAPPDSAAPAAKAPAPPPAKPATPPPPPAPIKRP